MTAIIRHASIEDEFLAHVTDIAYRVVLRQGLSRSFLEVELDLWEQIRSAYRTSELTDRPQAASSEGGR